MANFKVCVRRPRNDGFWQVYIRVTHHRGLGYIKTDKMVTKKELTKTSEIKDAFVLSYCADLIILLPGAGKRCGRCPCLSLPWQITGCHQR